MDEEDFESLLDAAFGIESVHPETALKHVAAGAEQCQRQQQQAHPSSGSLGPSPTASPTHMYPTWPHVASPCMSDASMQMHASPPHSSCAATGQHAALLYSPVREGSPSPEEQSSPAVNAGTAQTSGHSPAPHQHGITCDVSSQAPQPASAGTAAPQATQQHAPGSGSGRHQAPSLCVLPREVLMRVLCFLSADSLTSLAQACSQLRALCNEPVLWRRLFVHRWGKNVRVSNAQAWKARYMERDAAELQAAGAGAQGGDVFQDMFVQAQRAKRHKALGIGAIDDLMLVEDDEVAARVLAWRKSRGFVTQQGNGSLQPQRPSDLSLPPANLGSGHRAAAGFSGPSTAQQRPRVVRRPGAGAPAAAGGSSSSASLPAVAAAAAAASIGLQPPPAAAAGTGPLSDDSVHKQRQAAAGAGSSGVGVAASAHTAAAAAAARTASAAAVSPGQHLSPLLQSSPSPAAAGPNAVSRGAATGGSKSQGSSGQAGSSKAARRRRSRQPRRWTQIGNVFCDEQTGWVHVCDETCSEKIVEASSGLLVCPISGTCSARLLTCAEEAAEEGERDPETEHREEEFGGERGRLARAFAAGYYCSDERELMRECGVYLPR